ncbi:cytochrome c3 family protein [Thermodesulfobacteriota bacterium]
MKRIISLFLNHKSSYFHLEGNRVIILFLLLFFFLGIKVLLPKSQVWAAGLEILTPLPGSTLIARNPETHLIIRQPLGAENVSQVKVQSSNVMLEPVVAMEGEEYDYIHFRLPLKTGLNNFTILPSGQRLEFAYQPLKALLPVKMDKFYLFHQESELPEYCIDCHELHETKTLEPVGIVQQISCIECHENIIKKYEFQHSTTANLQCLSCHLQIIKPWRIGFPQGKIDERCLTCHTGKKNWQSRKYRHQALIGGCTLCHDPHGSDYKSLLWAESSLEICLGCHDDKKRLMDKDNPIPYVHKIIFGNGCVACHDSHASDNLFMLHKSINPLCNSCHQILPAGQTRGHPMGNHPVAGPSERRRPGRELTCTGCHDPHGSAYKNLLVQTQRGGQLCRGCHKR